MILATLNDEKVGLQVTRTPDKFVNVEASSEKGNFAIVLTRASALDFALDLMVLASGLDERASELRTALEKLPQYIAAREAK
jgi:hypothetical protein